MSNRCQAFLIGWRVGEGWEGLHPALSTRSRELLLSTRSSYRSARYWEAYSLSVEGNQGEHIKIWDAQLSLNCV